LTLHLVVVFFGVKVAPLLAALWLTIETRRPALCAIGYAFAIGLMIALAGGLIAPLHFALAVLLSFALSLAYFLLVKRFDRTRYWWPVVIVGFVICFV
jgi:hypothetical protein